MTAPHAPFAVPDGLTDGHVWPSVMVTFGRFNGARIAAGLNHLRGWPLP